MKSLANQSASWVFEPRVKTPGQTFGAPLLFTEAVPGKPATVDCVLGAVVVADVGRRIHIAVGVVEIESVVLVGQQHRAQAGHPAVIHVVEGALVGIVAGCNRGLVVVGVVMPFQVVAGA